jgi:NADP-dependent 3-hydroxy acid dehydrogenase YdfG
LSGIALTMRPAVEPVSLAGKVALVTGATSGIGRAIALALAGERASVVPVGRNQEELDRIMDCVREMGGEALPCRVDLRSVRAIEKLVQTIGEMGHLDILVHSAGIIVETEMRSARVRDLDAQYLANVRGPYALTQAALPLLKASRGQVVFINSSAGTNAKRANVGQFSATQFAMKAVADSLREEVNCEGVRVLTVHPGRTATPRQQAMHAKAGRPYRPELLMQPEDVAAMVVAALRLPGTAEVTDLHIRPMIKS